VRMESTLYDERPALYLHDTDKVWFINAFAVNAGKKEELKVID